MPKTSSQMRPGVGDIDDDGDAHSDYDPLFDDDENACDGGVQQGLPKHPGQLASHAAASAMITAPIMRSVENVGTIALPASPQFFSERPCTPSTSSQTAAAAASHIASSSGLHTTSDTKATPASTKKRRREVGDDLQRRSVRARTSPPPPSPASTSRAHSVTIDRPGARPTKGVITIVPRPQPLTTRPSIDGSFADGIASFLRHDIDFIAAVRSFIYLLTNPPDRDVQLSSTARIDSPQKPHRKVPANAVDWDIPFPFPEGEAPPGYYELWPVKRARRLLEVMVASLRRAVFKVESLYIIQSKRESSGYVPIGQYQVSQRAKEVSSSLIGFIRNTMVGEAPMISVDITSIPETIGEAFPAHELAQTFCTEPLARDKVVAAVTVGIIAAHEKFGQSVSMIGSASGPSSVQPPPPEYPLPPPLSLPWEDSTAVPATATATSQSPLDASILDLSASLDLPLLNLPSDFPLDPALVTPDPFTNLSLAMPPLSHPSSSGPMNPDDEASVLDWLFGTTNSAPLFDLPTTSESVVPIDPAPALVVTASDPFTAASLSSYSTPDASAFSLPLTWSSSSSSSHSAYASESTSTSQARSRISNLNPITSVDEPTPRKRSAAGRPTPKLPPPSTLLKGKGKGKTKANDEADKNGSRWTSKGTLSMVSDTGARKRALTRPEIEQIQKAARNGASTLASASASKNASVDANRTLVVKDVKRRAEEVREKLKEQLLAVERELWALDIEAEVLSGLRKGAA